MKSMDFQEKPGKMVEVGAVNLFEDDWCLKEAMEEVGLKLKWATRGPENRVRLWDGE